MIPSRSAVTSTCRAAVTNGIGSTSARFFMEWRGAGFVRGVRGTALRGRSSRALKHPLQARATTRFVRSVGVVPELIRESLTKPGVSTSLRRLFATLDGVDLQRNPRLPASLKSVRGYTTRMLVKQRVPDARLRHALPASSFRSRAWQSRWPDRRRDRAVAEARSHPEFPEVFRAYLPSRGNPKDFLRSS